MTMQFLSRVAFVALATAGVASAQDECAVAVNLPLNTATAFSNVGSTTSLPAWPCGAGGNDIWYSIAVASAGTLGISTCGSSYDTTVEVFSGTCAALVSLGCNDDSCALQSTLNVAVTPGTYFLRIGGFGAATGAGTVTASIGAPPAPCNGGISTVGYVGGNFGNPGGAVYFNLTVSAAVTLSGLQTNFTAAAGTPVGITVHTTPTTHVGNEGNPAAWTQVAVDNGTATAAGNNLPTAITFASALNLSPGTYGIALVASASTPHGYTNGTGGNQNFVNGVFSISAGSATNFPFAAPVFTPRVWNGQLCEGGPTAPGTNYCTANANSTGQTGMMSATGSNVVAANSLTLEAARLPNNAFGFFITSTTQAFTPNPGGSLGNLCLGGAIGRYVGPGQIQNSGGTGSVALAINLTQIPTPTGFISQMAGVTRSFQCWHRDSVGGLAVSNFTDGYQIAFQ